MKIEHFFNEIEIYLFGRRFGNTEYLWEMAPTGNYQVTFMLTAAPCVLHRWAQTLLLGIRYRRIRTK